MKSNKPLLQNWNIALLMLLVIVLYSVINWLTPLWCDDLDYGDTGHTFEDIVHREVYDYFHANGRIFSHTLVQLFAGILGKPFFNMLNPLLTLLMVVLLPIVSGEVLKVGVNKWRWFSLFSLSLIMVWYVLPDQYITMFMIAGSSNYIWAAVFNLLFVYVFTQQLTKGTVLKGWMWAFIIILSFFAGAWMEMYSVALAPALFLYLLFHIKCINKQMAVAFICYVVGTAIVVFAPGNFERHEQDVGGHPGAATWIVTQLELAIRFKLVWVWALSLVLVIVELIKKQFKIEEFLENTMIWIVGILVSYAFLFVSGVTSYRSQWAIYLFSFIILFFLLKKVRVKNLYYVLMSLMLLTLVFVDFCKEFEACSMKRAAVSELLHEAQTKTLTEGCYYLWPQTIETRKSIPTPTGLNGSWPGKFFSSFYRLDHFVVMPESVYLYCSGNRTEVGTYLGCIPMVDGMAVLPLDISATGVTVRYDYEKKRGYVFHNKSQRILEAFGIKSLARKVYDSKNEMFLGKVLLEEIDPLETEVRLSGDVDNNFLFDYRDTRYVAASLEVLSPKYDVPVISCCLMK